MLRVSLAFALLAMATSAPAPPGARIRSTRPRKMVENKMPQVAPAPSGSVRLPMEIAPERRPIRDQRRGPFAWQVVRNQHSCSPGDWDRLLVHSVADETALRSYLPAVRDFVAWAEEYSPVIASWSDLDRVITLYLTACCYLRDMHPLQGALLMNGLAYLMPELSRSLPRAWRASKAWSDLSVVREGGPMSLQALACMEAWLTAQTTPAAKVSADMIFPAVDGYLREQDLLGLRARDVCVVDDQVVLMLGRSDRGDRSKTGRDQGVSLDDPYSRGVFLRRLQGLGPDAHVFPITAAQYRLWWGKAGRAVLGGKAHVPSPHSARHTGASRDLAEGYRTFSQVQRRGRWKVPGSVQRYAKTHVWRAIECDLPHDVRTRGNDILRARPLRASCARD